MKDFVLNQFKLTPRQYKARFDQAEKRPDEAYMMFSARIRNNFRYYLRSCEIGEDFERLCELMISDKLRSCLPNGPLNYVLAAEAGSWHTPDKVAKPADTYDSNHASVQNPKFVGDANVSSQSPERNRKSHVMQNKFKRWPGARTGQNSNQRAFERRCFIFNKVGHIVRRGA